MSAPMAVEALVTLPSKPFLINSSVDCCACGDVGEGEHFPGFRACSGSGGGAAGRRSRSSTYPRAFRCIGLLRCAVAKALVLPLLVVEAEPVPDPGRRFGNARIGV